MIQIQATFAGYGDKACSLFSAYDADARVLVVGAEADYRTERRDHCIVLTNIPDLPRDSLFVEEDLSAAIGAFYALKAGVAADGKSSRLVFAKRAARANPEQSIEQDGIEASGPRYRISAAITCAQVAALATCQYALRSETVERAVELADHFRRLALGGIVTI
ncbi:hypothetical protein [Burkholderia plantarii]|uniref:hypothetical protein n=1 Tax=Burkholderia plantarii TaxID=41899 RepID=UPI0006D89B0D|nr:hypothetical protein [Burkholderia plantarii]ALK30854.1 hypothetical protein bpln_1g20660 [Burkholderia plantarii]GLZ19484.1 hypothetical protein Bpla01_30140 [Burkholderia plantarii]